MVLWMKALIVGAAILVTASLKYMWPSYKDDNPVEECIEEVIKEQLGVAVDLTPLSEEP